MFFCFFFSSRRRHTSCALVTGVQTCALPILAREYVSRYLPATTVSRAESIAGEVRKALAGAIELLLGFTGLQPGVAHFAHLGGMLFGWLLINYWRGDRKSVV